MLLRKVALHNFRIYRSQVVEFGDGVNVIYGANGQGKTSLLEAVYFLVAGRSFRTSRLKDLVRKDSPYFALEADFTKHGVQQRLSVSCNGAEKRIAHNKTPCRSVGAILGLLLGVVMTPDDIALVKGTPQIRRRFLDLHIAQVDPLYVHHLMRYYRALKQRNHLLRSGKLVTVQEWEAQMAPSAGYIAVRRAEAVKDLSQRADQLYTDIAEDGNILALEYRPKQPLHDVGDASLYYLEQWERHRRREIEAGHTLVGPHRDEMLMALGSQEARYFASEGQQRSIIAALRFAEWKRLKTMTGEIPLMMIDDLTAGLDDNRRKRFLQLVASLGQVFLASVDTTFADGQIIHLHDGAVVNKKNGVKTGSKRGQNGVRLDIGCN